MSHVEKSVGAAWLLCAVMCSGCSINGQGPAMVAPQASTTTSADFEPKTGKELVAQIKELASKPPTNDQGPAAMIRHIDKIIELCQKALAESDDLDPSEPE